MARDATVHAFDHAFSLDLGEGAFVDFEPGFVADHEALAARLAETLPLAPATIVLFGKPVQTPRLVSFHGDAGRSYGYSGRRFEPAPLTPELSRLRARLRERDGTDYGAVLVNVYRDGRDSMGEHADDEPELGPSRDDVRIASISLGARRRFVLRHARSGALHAFFLGEGSLLVMRGTTQRHWRHRVPRTATPVGPRTNLTFRVVRVGG